MRTLYLDCGMGAAGDMLTAALLELLPEPEKMIERLNRLGIPDVEYRMEPAEKCGITGTYVRVLVHGEEEGEHHHDHDHHDHDHDHHDHDHHDHDHHDHDHDHHDHDHDHHDHDHHEHDHHDHDHHDHDHHDHDHHEHDHDHHDHGHDHDHHDHDHHDHAHHDHDHHGHHHHVHRTLGEIRDLVMQLPLEEPVRDDIIQVYTSIAEAEGHVHGKPVEEIHFHEVGTWDAVADVTAVSMLLHELHPDEIIVSPVHVGSGQVECAHGILPVPAPATAYLLRDIPIYGGKIRGELCTPTGAALLRHFATGFGEMPVLRMTGIGYGMGKKDFPAANCIRAILGGSEGSRDTVLCLSCNVDDMTPEATGYAMEQLYAAGAREVFTVPVGMKKNRPGTLLQVICTEEKKDTLVKCLFLHTTTLGIREQRMGRYTLDRQIETVNTPYGPVRRKTASGYGVTRSKWEYDDLARIARETGMSLEEIRKKLV